MKQLSIKLKTAFMQVNRNKAADTIWRAFVLASLLFLLWLLLSGKWTDGNGLLLGLGLVSATAIAFFIWWIGLLDRESLPIALFHPVKGIWRFWLWLAVETIKANIAVARVILSYECDTHQRLFWIPSRQMSDLTRAIYANSITLTPGTITVDMAEDHLLIHALNDKMCDSLDEMACRICSLDTNTIDKDGSEESIQSC